MDRKKLWREAARAGIVWGAVGGIVGFLVSLVGALAGIIASGFVGASCGRRAARSLEGVRTPGDGAAAGLAGGLVAMPVFVVGSAAGALVSASSLGSRRIAATLSDATGMDVSPGEAWQIMLLSITFAAFFEAVIFVACAVAAGALLKRKG